MSLSGWGLFQDDWYPHRRRLETSRGKEMGRHREKTAIHKPEREPQRKPDMPAPPGGYISVFRQPSVGHFALAALANKCTP